MLRWRAGLLSVLLLTACGSGDPSAAPAPSSSAAAPRSFTLVATGTS